MMSTTSQREYLQTIQERYRKAGKAEQGIILNEFCRICNYNHKYAIGLLGTASTFTNGFSSVKRRGRRPPYRHPDVITFLKR